MSKEYKEVYTILDPEKDGEKSRWIRIGVAFPNKDDSLNVILNCLPINGKLHIRPPKAKDNGSEEEVPF